jgi:phosphatidylethanolamine/phosphatidyl-N-methylethanolamine N-methyltransferase
MNNTWNQVIYKVWAPFYDRIFNTGSFKKARSKIINENSFEIGQKILFVGIGTGADLELIKHDNLDITAINLSSDMLNMAQIKFKNSSVKFIQMDAQELLFENESFDLIIANLILSVVPDPKLCLNELERCLKQNGKIILFDKFAPINKSLTPIKKILRHVISLMGTDIELNFEKLFFHLIEY